MDKTTHTIHHTAIDGYTTGAEAYTKGRPDYPPEVAEWLCNSLGLDSNSTVIDLGAGTGKFTPNLVKTGAKVIAVEPVTEMLRKLSEALPEVDVVLGTAESIPLPDAFVDAIICAQSFHWFATEAALKEIHRVLKPQGKLGMVWNKRDEEVEWVARLDQLVNQFEGDVPRYYTGAWRNVFPFPGLSSLHESYFIHHHVGSPEDVIINRVRSTSFIAALKADLRATLEEQIRTLISVTPELAGKEVVAVPYKTTAFYCEKTG